MRSIRIQLIALVMVGLVVGAAVWVGAGTTGIVSGAVKGEDGKPLSGANIIITGTKLSTVADAHGFYVITNVPPGDYEVRAEMVGYAAASVSAVSVTMDATAAVNFDMKQEAIKETTAVVTRPRPMIAADQVNTLDLITSGQEKFTRTDPTGDNTVPGVLGTVPGVFVEPNQLGAMHIRGGDSNQIGYYIEGIPITDPNLGTFSDNMFSTGIGKFQVYTGGFGAEYGNAIAGVMNEVKKTGDTSPGIRMATFGGTENYRSATTEVGGSTPGGFSFYAANTMQRNNISGSLMLEKQTYTDNVAKLVFPWKNDSLTVIAMQGNLQGDLGSPMFTVDGDFMRQKYAIAGAVWSHSFNPKSFITVRPYYIRVDALSSVTHNFPLPYSVDATSDQAGLTAGYTNQLSDRQLLKFGGSVLKGDNSEYTRNPFFYRNAISSLAASADTLQSALYVEDQLKLASKTTLVAGARYEGIVYSRNGLTGSLPDMKASSLNPRLGLSYAANSRTVWKASWGKYTKFVPADMISAVASVDNGAGGMDYSTVLGDGDPQQSTAGEISFEKQVSDSLACRITPYYANYKNLAGATYDAAGFSHYANIGTGESRGIEFSARKKVSSNWQGWLSYTYQTVKAGTAGQLMQYTAWDQRHTVSAIADYATGRWDHNLRVDYGSGVADTTVGRMEPHAVFTYGLNMAMSKGAGANTLSLSIYNLFNNRQAQISDGITPARCLSIGLNRAL